MGLRVPRGEQPVRTVKGQAASRTYQLYGLTLASCWPLPCPEKRGGSRADIRLSEGRSPLSPRHARTATRGPSKPDWFRHVRRRDGSDYLCWTGLFEFLVSPDGRHITCRALNEASQEAFQTYLIGQVLSFALLKQGVEPLHATVVDVEGRAVAFLGDCGHGKSTLGAAFLRAGHRLLTDDLLVVESRGSARPHLLAHPGPPRLKLLPEIAKALLDGVVTGTAMNPHTSKLVIPLDRHRHSTRAIPLGAIYVLRPPKPGRESRRVTIRNVPRRRAFVDLLVNSFNCMVTEPRRLRRQFEWAAELAAALPLKSLSYPRHLAGLPDVVRAIHANLAA